MSEDERALDSFERQLLLVLQLGPMLPWTTVAAILGVERATPRRRWEQIQREHFAVIGVQPELPSFTQPHRMVRIQVEPASRTQAAEELVKDPNIMSVGLATGTDDILVYYGTDEATLSFREIQSSLSGLPGIQSVRFSHVFHTFLHPRNYQIRPLNEAEEAVVGRTIEALQAEGNADMPAIEIDQAIARVLLARLRLNARTPLNELNTIENEARRRLNMPTVSDTTTRRERRALLAEPANRVRCWLPLRPAAKTLHFIQAQISPGDRGKVQGRLARVGRYVLWAVQLSGIPNLMAIVPSDKPEIVDIVLQALADAGASEICVERIYSYAWGRASSETAHFMWPDDPRLEKLWPPSGLLSTGGEEVQAWRATGADEAAGEK